MPDKKSRPKRRILSDLEAEGKRGYSPSEFMRARHPDLFSDSRLISTPQLSKGLLEYHLDTLTSRKQEIEFEHFARKLAEKEICPNLIPQTGPVGGGDSKVDTETYPVADELALRWYEGIGQKASHERWAFAFSAKKVWRPKVQSDVQKMVDTNRGYEQIFFVSNQFIPDKARSEVEDGLAQKHGVGVRILDRSWILKCIFDHGRLRLAAEALNIAGYDEAAIEESGPHDVARQQELKELEDQINDAERYKGVQYQLVEDCLQAALLARGLELPRVDVDGRFDRSERLATELGHHQQQLRVIYNRAWTYYWWYEDYQEFNHLYDRVQELAVGSTFASDLELLANVWQLLHTAVREDKIGTEQGKLVDRTFTLKAELDRLAENTQRPNNALQAKTYRLLVDLTERVVSGENLDVVFASLKDVLKKSGGLGEYSFTTISQIIQELGDFLTDSPKYDALLEVVLKATEQRTSVGEAGRLLLVRGQQMLRAGKRYEAIRILGRAQQKLALDEYREEWILAAAACGVAYEGVGLLWAARSNILAAASLSFSEYANHGHLSPHLLLLLQKLVWLELQLGRIPQVLAWMDAASIIAAQLVLEESKQEKYLEERRLQDAVLGILMLKADVSVLKWLDFLPPVLDQEGLLGSWLSLLYSLGYEDYLRSENAFPKSEGAEAVRDFFYKLRNQPASKDVPDQPDPLLGTTVILHSFVLGCDVVVEVANNLTSVYFAETILGVLEAFLATSFDSEIMPYRSELPIRVEPAEFLSGLPEYKEEELATAGKLTIRHPTVLNESTEDRIALRSWLQDFVVSLTFQIAAISDFDSFANQLLKREAGLGRALIFADVDTAIGNLLGKTPKFSLSDWKPKDRSQTFPYKRSKPWDADLSPAAEINQEKVHQPIQFGDGELPNELFGIDNLKHKDRQVVSFINLPLWDKAKWRAVAYICAPNEIPIMVLGFEEPEAAALIFKEWNRRLGQIDRNDQLRISVIIGIDKMQPSSYSVVVSSSLSHLEERKYKHVALVSRIQVLDSPDPRNLQSFLTEYRRAGIYRLLPAAVHEGKTIYEPLWENWIGKSELVLRPAWEIGVNDPDVAGILEGMNPIIPENIKNAPVIAALQRFSKPKKRRRH